MRVTEALKLGGLCDVLSYSDDARWRGSAVHTATMFEDQNDLDHRTLPARIKPFVSGWINCKKSRHFEILGIEELVEERAYGYRGTLDRRVRFLRGPWKGKQGIVDIKTTTGGGIAPMVRWQMAAYGYAKRKEYLWPTMAVVLHEDGSFAFKSWGPEHFTEHVHDFLACLRVARLREQNLLGGNNNV